MRVLAAFVLMSLAASPAMANRMAVRQACQGDIATLCQGVQPGEGRLKACLKANKEKLSQGCKSAIAALIEARRAAGANRQSPAQPAPPVTSAPVP